MKDISKCSGVLYEYGGVEKVCPLRDTCLRFTVHSDNLWQSNIAPAWDGERKTCWNRLEVKK